MNGRCLWHSEFMETISYKCINCGGPLQYDAQKLKFACEYCRSEYTEDELAKHFGKLDEKLNEEAKEEPVPTPEEEEYGTAALYVCQNCGAEVVAETTNTAATFCVYCHNPVVLSNRLTGSFKPDKVIPFKISEKDAKQRFLDFCGKKKFLPNDFLSTAQLDMMRGVYYPYWLVDSLKAGGVHATAKKIRTWREGDYEYTETKTYKVKRFGRIDFHGFPHPGLKKDDNLKALKYVNPYNDNDFIPFKMPYLSGFLAEKRDLERNEAQADVDASLRQYAEKIYKDSIQGYDRVTIDDLQLSTINESWAYGLLPVWMMTFDYNGKKYLYAMNGQTGKNFGELPISKAKLAIFGVVMFIVLLLLGMLGGYLLL